MELNQLPEEPLFDVPAVADGGMAGTAPLLPGQGQARPRLVLPPRRVLRLRMVQVRDIQIHMYYSSHLAVT